MRSLTGPGVTVISVTTVVSYPIEHKSFDCQTQSNLIEVAIKFGQSNAIKTFD